MEEILGFVLIFSVLIILGWLLFSLSAGVVVYHSTMSTAHASIEPQAVLEAEKRTIAYSHTKDPIIMGPVSEGRERWEKLRTEGLFDELSLLSKDGLTLYGFYWPENRHPGKQDRGYTEKLLPVQERTVLLLHGLMDSASGMQYLAEAYHLHGWNVCMIDQRAHGESEGKYRTMGVRESEDLGFWVNLVAGRYGSRNIYIHGVSMGGATALLYGANRHIRNEAVRGLISDSSYSDYGESLVRVLESMVKYRFLARSITFGANIISFLHTGVRFGRMNPEKVTHTIPIPVLLFHGQKDVLIPVGMARKLFSRAVKPSDEMVVVPEAPHIGPFFYAGEFYVQKILDFVRRT